ncbi:MAG: FHA domain-containing protein [Anaerolineaceae bacterium]|nr:FHA domain-containing protein [Anaerolineaceae bacterium]
MIICPGCKYEELEGRLFCSNCGASLTRHEQEVEKKPETRAVIVELLDFNRSVRLLGKEKFVLGRSVPSQPESFLDLDLRQYNGFEYGVSRKHAMLRLVDQGIQIVDLNSSNRTYIDGEEIYPWNEYDVDGKSVIRLGKLRIRVSLED